jgi:hypothetical protein
MISCALQDLPGSTAKGAVAERDHSRRHGMFTGYHIEDGYIIGGEMSGRFYIEDAVIKGPKNSGRYYISDNCICGPEENGHFFIEDGYIYGPNKEVPWLRD